MTRVLLATVFGLTAVVGGRAAADDVFCTIKVEACGEAGQTLAPFVKLKEGVCLMADLKDVGTKPKGVYVAAKVWVGFSVSADTLILGSAEAKTGLLLTCGWGRGQPKPDEQLKALKAELPALLADKKLRTAFPQLKKIDTRKLTVLQPADSDCARVLLSTGK